MAVKEGRVSGRQWLILGALAQSEGEWMHAHALSVHMRMFAADTSPGMSLRRLQDKRLIVWNMVTNVVVLTELGASMRRHPGRDSIPYFAPVNHSFRRYQR